MIPVVIVPRLAKLLPMLSSDKDQEALAALRMIAKTLGTVGADFHDLTATIVKGKVVNAPLRKAGDYNYADAYRQAETDGRDVLHPRQSTLRFGLAMWHPDQVIPWWEIARHCIAENRALPKRSGGKFLRPDQVRTLEQIAGQVFWPTNELATWMETVVARLQQARDHDKRERPDHAGT